MRHPSLGWRALLLACVLAPASAWARPALEELLEKNGGQAPAPAPPAKAKAQDEPDKCVLGDREVIIAKQVFEGKNKAVLYLNVHDNENACVKAAEAVLKETGGTLVDLRHDGKRMVSFNLAGKGYCFDPNRIFTPQGRLKTIRTFKPGGSCDRSLKIKGPEDPGHVAVKDCSDRLIAEYIENQKVIVALHNNAPDGYSILEYKAGGSEAKSARTDKTIVVPEADTDDFFFVTKEERWKPMSKLKVNLAIQSEAVTPGSDLDDGSLSVYAASHDIDYVNVEAELSHQTEQEEMLRRLPR